MISFLVHLHFPSSFWRNEIRSGTRIWGGSALPQFSNFCFFWQSPLSLLRRKATKVQLVGVSISTFCRSKILTLMVIRFYGDSVSIGLWSFILRCCACKSWDGEEDVTDQSMGRERKVQSRKQVRLNLLNTEAICWWLYAFETTTEFG